MNGKITISRPYGAGADYIEIELIDESSMVRFARVYIDYKNFALALAGQGGIPCEFELTGVNLVGKTLEIKQESVLVPSGDFPDRVDIATAAVSAAEKDGWQGRVSDALNHHKVACYTKDGTWYDVTFSRYVDTEIKEEQ